MTTINLLPDDYMTKRARRRADVFIGVLTFVVIAGVISAEVASERSNNHTREARDRVNKSYQEAARLIGQVQHLEAKRAEMLTKAEHSAALIEKVPRSHLLAMITQALPQDASIERLQLDTKRAQPQEQPKSNKLGARKGKAGPPSNPVIEALPVSTLEARITGLAVTDVEVARFIANLARNRLVNTVDLVYSQEKIIDRIPVREFQIKMTLKPNADVLNTQGHGGANPQTLFGQAGSGGM